MIIYELIFVLFLGEHLPRSHEYHSPGHVQEPSAHPGTVNLPAPGQAHTHVVVHESAEGYQRPVDQSE